ncbi:MAG: alpha/beta fold hydrolase [Candidatus Gallimonas sp.]
MRGISYLRAGSGKDLVFLHGYLASKESFYPQITYFSRFYRVTALDFPGFGQSPPLDAPWSVSDYADWTEEFLRSEGIEFPHVVAHSFGGRVAVKCLSRGEIFDRAALCGCAGIVRKRTIAYRAKVAAYRAVKKIAPGFAERNFGSAEYRTLSPVMRESYKKIVNEDLRADAAKITRPVLFLNGDRDGETPVSSAQIYHAAVKGSELLILQGCGHFAHLDNPSGFNLAVEEFFK